MNLRLPYLRDHELLKIDESSSIRPVRAFIVRPQNYRVIDGDTIAVITRPYEGAPPRTSFRIRLSGVNAMEMPPKRSGHATLRRLGLDPNAGHPAEVARERFAGICAGNALLVCPPRNRNSFEQDKFGRILADICVSGTKGKDFYPLDAYSAAWRLHSEGVIYMLSGEPILDQTPQLLENIQHEARMSQLDDANAQDSRISNPSFY